MLAEIGIDGSIKKKTLATTLFIVEMLAKKTFQRDDFLCSPKSPELSPSDTSLALIRVAKNQTHEPKSMFYLKSKIRESMSAIFS